MCCLYCLLSWDWYCLWRGLVQPLEVEVVLPLEVGLVLPLEVRLLLPQDLELHRGMSL